MWHNKNNHKIDPLTIHQMEITVKHFAKQLRLKGEPSPAEVSALAKLAGEYRALVEASRKDGNSRDSYYEEMEKEALRETQNNR